MTISLILIFIFLLYLSYLIKKIVDVLNALVRDQSESAPNQMFGEVNQKSAAQIKSLLNGPGGIIQELEIQVHCRTIIRDFIEPDIPNWKSYYLPSGYGLLNPMTFTRKVDFFSGLTFAEVSEPSVEYPHEKIKKSKDPGFFKYSHRCIQIDSPVDLRCEIKIEDTCLDLDVDQDLDDKQSETEKVFRLTVLKKESEVSSEVYSVMIPVIDIFEELTQNEIKGIGAGTFKKISDIIIESVNSTFKYTHNPFDTDDPHHFSSNYLDLFFRVKSTKGLFTGCGNETSP